MRKEEPLTLEIYKKLKKDIKENASLSYFLIFVLISEYGFLTSDLIRLRMRNIVINSKEICILLENGNTYSLPEIYRSEIARLYSSCLNKSDYFFHTINRLQIQHSNFTAFIKRLGEKHGVTSLSCKKLTAFSGKYVKINYKFEIEVTDSCTSENDYIKAYCFELTHLINSVSSLTKEFDKNESSKFRHEQYNELIRKMHTLTMYAEQELNKLQTK